MYIFGIVAEYNPFHNGHKFQLDKARELGATHIVAIMSPNFTQRGEPSVVNKFYRAQAAIKSGVDLVLELPTKFALSCAQRFAFGAVYILNKLNIVDKLIFGTELDDIKILKKIAQETETNNFNKILLETLKTGLSFPRARQVALENILGLDIAFEISKPNNILAIEYIKSLNKLKSNIEPLPIKRVATKHDSTEIFDNKITSAFNLRKIIKESNSIKNWKSFVPEQSFEVYKKAFLESQLPVLESRAQVAILSKLRSLDLDQIKLIPDISEGLENRIFKSIKNSGSLEEIYNNIKTKRYTMSRVRRAIYNLFLDIRESDFNLLPEFVRVLGCNTKGTEIINKIKKSSDIYIDNNIKRLSKINKNIEYNINFEIRSTDIYNLFCKNILPCNLDLTNKFFVF
ncbi:MAG: nucleotidyltransferase [Oscillospiraceae bacterium]|nr:nucleotidyltransferase [Oscillospiraceae bacterium]